jgi:hypothetical protein
MLLLWQASNQWGEHLWQGTIGHEYWIEAYSTSDIWSDLRLLLAI